ncbi:hypothetical protein [Desertivirga brevis]|uniref:hypothetical protein n=1 Tax=Desertivirga brevis TaxID=2810310 RepID=UPI001A95C572|nr:hypothetical protein [Pedobacter sp. SYSU D00873]
MNRVALLIIFNHNYEGNLDRLSELYSSRFQNIWFIMPFYTGSRKDVIAVYENSFYFQGYVTTALKAIELLNFDHYFFISDDLYLNPEINEANYREYFRVDETTAFIPGIFSLNDSAETRPFRPHSPWWPHLQSAIQFTTDQRGIEVAKMLPTYEEALTLLAKHGFAFSGNLDRKMFFGKNVFRGIRRKKDVSLNIERLKLLSDNFKYILRGAKLQYPLVGSYSDIFIIPRKNANQFSLYCGIFSALHLFVEIAIPTALCLSADKIVMEDQLGLKGETYWRSEGIRECERTYKKSLNYLYMNFPREKLYIHPVKLSRWT